MYKLGKLAPKFHPRTLALSKYLLQVPPPPPKKVFREYKVASSAWGMYGNDTIRDCTCAAKAHILMLMTSHTSALFTPDEADIIKAYSDITGYDPATGTNDNGAPMTDVFEYWRVTGIAGHKILAWAQIDHRDLANLRQAIYLFGVADVGVQFPQSAMDQLDAGQAWDVVPEDGGTLGGHDVPLFGYGRGGFDCVTWSMTQQLTNAWAGQYIDEAYVPITQDWINASTKRAPNSLDLAALETDLAALTSAIPKQHPQP